MIAGFVYTNLVCYGSSHAEYVSRTQDPAPHAVAPCRLRPRRGRDRSRAVRVRHAVAAVRHLSRAVGLLAARADARLLRLRVRCARLAAARRPPLRRGRAPPGAARRARHAVGASVLFMFADSVVWLFAARGVQGIATGLALGAASAALLDLHPRRDPAGVGLTNGVVSASGMGFGVLVSAALVQLAPAPRVLPYVVLLVLFAVAFVGALLMPEPVESTGQAPADAAAAERARRGPAPVPARLARRDLVLVGRRPVPLARPAAVGEPVPHRQPPRRRPRRLRAGRLRRRRAARVRPHGAVGGRGGGLGRARHRPDRDRARLLDGLGRAVLDRRGDRRRWLRRRLPRRPARAVGGRAAAAPRGGDVGVLHRRLRRDLAPRDPGGRARHAARAWTPRSRSSAA